MRLAQTLEKQKPIPVAFMRLRREDREVLSDEMARTGAADQRYSCSQPKVDGGPAFLVYYSPAFVRKLAPKDTGPALALLAEIYRCARKLWPLEEDMSGTVTVRIDQVKELTLQEIQSVYGSGDSWLLSRRNDKEAVVERHPLDYMGELLQQEGTLSSLASTRRTHSPYPTLLGYATVVLKFWNDRNTDRGTDSESARARRISSGPVSPMGLSSSARSSGAVTPKEAWERGMAAAMEKAAADRERVTSDRGTDGLALNTWARKNRSDSIS
ncbi:MAG: hypothetical protein SGPRY_011671, partial [Prymnesium sp.]